MLCINKMYFSYILPKIVTYFSDLIIYNTYVREDKKERYDFSCRDYFRFAVTTWKALAKDNISQLQHKFFSYYRFLSLFRLILLIHITV